MEKKFTSVFNGAGKVVMSFTSVLGSLIIQLPVWSVIVVFGGILIVDGGRIVDSLGNNKVALAVELEGGGIYCANN